MELFWVIYRLWGGGGGGALERENAPSKLFLDAPLTDVRVILLPNLNSYVAAG